MHFSSLVPLLLVICAASLSYIVEARRGRSELTEKQINYYKRTGIKFLEDKKAEEGVHALPSGMLFKILKKGTGEKSPNIGDECDVHYSGTLRDGTKFDSSYDRGEPAKFAPNQVISGWTEALQLMREGDKWIVYIPYELGYGKDGKPSYHTGYSPLVFEMELIKVNGNGKTAEDASKLIMEKLGKAYSDL